ncbi:SDR family oxidoreductase [Aliikangiella marina]|uniref:SDR family oxidoreductase n=1 Tax=Aliikangiella marina TaxID=1712262 RepID=A0A545TI60_9GAMM|nr:SDR family oxidoreductase [Aliikangiella marina]TQV76904.1 SDR family oxidoreductase [Aliikangiella marina]
MDLRNQVVWITGASSGIGAELANQLDKIGAKLILSARNEAALIEWVKSSHHPDNHKVISFDLMNIESFPSVVASAQQAFGQIDVLINNGGISQRSLALDTELAVDRQVMEVDYFAPVALTKAVVPLMITRGSGLVVNIASVAGKIGSPLRSAYAGAKHALIGFMDCLRAEIASAGVRVVNICPGFVRTNISFNALTANNSQYGLLDEEIASGMPVDEFVTLMLRKLSSNQSEIIIASGKPKLGYQLRRFLPNLYHRLLPKLYQRRG